MIYAGANVYPGTTVYPDPNAPATAGDLARIAQDMADRTTFELARLRAESSPLKWECIDGDNIEVAPVFGVVSFDTVPRYMQLPTATIVTAADIEGGVAPIGSAAYFLYMYWAGAPRFELSLAIPDAYRMYKSTGTDRVLVGVAMTDATAKFVQMRGSRRRVHFLRPSAVKAAGAATSIEVIDLASRVPVIADTALVSVNGRQSAATAFAYVAVGPGDAVFDGTTWNPVDPKLFRKLDLPPPVNGRVDTDLEIPLGHRPFVSPDPGNDRKIAVLTDALTSIIEVKLTGFTF